MNEFESRPIPFRGRPYNAYKATQQQRKMETAMRAQREKVQLLKAGGADPDDVMIARCKYQAQIDEYVRFSRRMGLPKQRERVYSDLRGESGAEKSNVFPE